MGEQRESTRRLLSQWKNNKRRSKPFLKNSVKKIIDNALPSIRKALSEIRKISNKLRARLRRSWKKFNSSGVRKRTHRHRR